MNRAVLAAFLCAGGPAAAGMCDPTDQMSPFNEAQWMTLEDAGATTSRVTVAPKLTERLAVENQPVEISAPASGLPSTSTAPDREPESGLR